MVRPLQAHRAHLRVPLRRGACILAGLACPTLSRPSIHHLTLDIHTYAHALQISESDAVFLKVDVDENGETAQKFDVMQMPVSRN